jgi:hypothetical protein
MEDLQTIINNFLNENEDIIESSLKQDLLNLRPNYRQELQAPGCTPCMRNSLKNKYTSIINNINKARNGEPPEEG